MPKIHWLEQQIQLLRRSEKYNIVIYLLNQISSLQDVGVVECYSQSLEYSEKNVIHEITRYLIQSKIPLKKLASKFH